MVTDKQVERFRKLRRAGKSQEEAAAKAGMTAKTARKYEDGPMPVELKAPRHWRTRPDPFEEHFVSDVVPLLRVDQEGELEARTLLNELMEKYPDRYNDGQLRTLQRRLRDWKAVEGPDKEVFFPQIHEPGRESQVDFTNCNELGVTISGEPFLHLFFELILCFSGWRFVQLAYSETFEAISDGIQNAFWALGGVTEVLCHDCLSAATKDLKATAGRMLTPRFKSLMDHYGVQSRRIQVRRANENGVVESGHGTLKSQIRQALILRGSSDFDCIEAYLDFVGVVVARLNQRCAARLPQEKSYLRPLPSGRIPSYTDVPVRVTSWSIIRVSSQVYSVPSRLIGLQVTARLHPTQVEILYNGRSLEAFPRLRGKGARRIDYRHVIGSLVRKPGAFPRYRFREELFPTLAFRRAYDHLLEHRAGRADVHYLKILHLAATTMECDVDAALQVLLESDLIFDSTHVEDLVKLPTPPRPEGLLEPLEPEFDGYDALLDELAREACYA
jgi:transcriptional regulator with XRE-family HTH domain